MFFTGIEGHKSLLRDLESRILSGQMTGYFLFEGPKGVGKFHVAMMVARYVACVGTQDDSCSCPSCRNFKRDPDIMVIGDHDHSVIKVDEMELIDGFLGSESHKGSPKILVINDVDRLSLFASDSLLKVLEEQNKEVLIILTTSFPVDVSSTLYSRLEKISFQPLKTEPILKILENRGVSGTRVKELAKFSKFMLHGFLSDPEGYARQRDNSIKFLKYLKSMDEDSILGILEDIQSQDGDSGTMSFIEMVVMSLSDISKIRMGATSHVVNVSKFELLEDMAQTWDESTILPVSNLFTKIIQEYKKDVAMVPRYRALKAASTAFNTIRVKAGLNES